MRRFLLALLAPPRGHVARAVEEALLEDQLRLSRRERRLLTSRVMRALDDVGLLGGR